MVTPFPDLLTFSLLAPFIIRVFLGIYFILWGWSAVRRSFNDGATAPLQRPSWATRTIAFLGIVAGLLTLFGFLTQIGAIALMALSAYFGRHTENRATFVLLFGMALSLLFSGAGFLAFDLPL